MIFRGPPRPTTLWAAISARLAEAGVQSPTRLAEAVNSPYSGDILPHLRPDLRLSLRVWSQRRRDVDRGARNIRFPAVKMLASKLHVRRAAIHATCSKNFEARSLRSMLTTATPA
jgi:uncharacterized membrane protein